MSDAKAKAAEQRKQALQAMDWVIQGLQTGQWALISGYAEHPPVAAAIMEGTVRLYLNALCIYNDEDAGSQYAQRMIDLCQPFADRKVRVDEDTWFDSLTPPLLEQLG